MQCLPKARVQAIARYDVLDSSPDPAFDRIARIAALCFGTPAASVTIVDTDRVWFKATHGLGDLQQIPRDPGMCATAIIGSRPYVVSDALTDPRAEGNPLVHGPHGFRFYAAAPILTADGHRLGTVNVLDTRARTPTDDKRAILTELAAIAMDELERRLSAVTTVRSERTQRDTAERDLESIEDYVSVLCRGGHLADPVHVAGCGPALRGFRQRPGGAEHGPGQRPQPAAVLHRAVRPARTRPGPPRIPHHPRHRALSKRAGTAQPSSARTG